MNNSSTERFHVTTYAQNHFTTFPGGGVASAPSCQCLRVQVSCSEPAQCKRPAYVSSYVFYFVKNTYIRIPCRGYSSEYW